MKYLNIFLIQKAREREANWYLNGIFQLFNFVPKMLRIVHLDEFVCP